MTNRPLTLQNVLHHFGSVVAIIAAMLVVAGVAGCSSNDFPPLGQVEGLVTLDGQPLADADVTFQPDQAGARASVGTTDSAGRYQLTFLGQAPGAIVGTHRVLITTLRNSDDSVAPIPEKLPARYHANSDVKAEVSKGNNTFDFSLESKP